MKRSLEKLIERNIEWNRQRQQEGIHDNKQLDLIPFVNTPQYSVSSHSRNDNWTHLNQERPMASPSNASTLGYTSNSSRSFNHNHQRRTRSQEVERKRCMSREIEMYDDAWDTFYVAFFRTLVIIIVLSITFSIVWLASLRYKAGVVVENVTVDNYVVGMGSDRTGVPTLLMSINLSAAIKWSNPSKIVEIRVIQGPLSLRYYQITVATGKTAKFRLGKKKSRTVITSINGSMVPLYGAGGGLKAPKFNASMAVDFRVWSRANVLGNLMKARQSLHVNCSFVIDTSIRGTLPIGYNSCSFS